jgi:hypothetical protein
LNIDVHGKTYASLMLSLPIELDPAVQRREEERAPREHV